MKDARMLSGVSDRLWNYFLDYLKTELSFNRVYFEGVFQKNKIKGEFLEGTTGMPTLRQNSP